LPVEFLAHPAECTDFASRLNVDIGKLRPIPASGHAVQTTFIFKVLVTATHVFLHHGVLQAPFVSPRRGDKTYFIEVQSAAKTVSIDHLKPACVLHINTFRFSTGYSFHCSGVSVAVGVVAWWTPLASSPT
jgi:hypothetical protein